MARGDDDIEKLLNEVEGALGSRPAGPGKGQPPTPARRADGAGGASPAAQAADAPGVLGRLRAGVPRALTVGAGCAVVVGGAFTVVPWVLHPISGAIGAFAAAVAVSLGGRVRRRR